MIPFQFHRRIPLVRRPFYQRDWALKERDQATAERDRVMAEREQLIAERDRAVRELDEAMKPESEPPKPLFELAKKTFSGDVGTKPPGFYARYDEFFANNDFTPTGILEIGVHQGESTKIFSSVYPDAKIVAFDLTTYDNVDFSDFPNISYLSGDQTDKARLEEVIRNEFPAGFDLVVEDASHIGAYSHITFHTVFPLMNAGGMYIIEDWGTGYFDDFPDGGRFQEYPLNFHDGNVPKRLPSHDFGMVGFVKSLVDLTSEPDIRGNQADPPKHKSRITTLVFTAAICMALKARD